MPVDALVCVCLSSECCRYNPFSLPYIHSFLVSDISYVLSHGIILFRFFFVLFCVLTALFSVVTRLFKANLYAFSVRLEYKKSTKKEQKIRITNNMEKNTRKIKRPNFNIVMIKLHKIANTLSLFCSLF